MSFTPADEDLELPPEDREDLRAKYTALRAKLDETKIPAAKALLKANGFVVHTEKSWRALLTRTAIAENIAASDRQWRESQDAWWRTEILPELHYYRDRCTFLYGEARAAGCTVEQLRGGPNYPPDEKLRQRVLVHETIEALREVGTADIDLNPTFAVGGGEDGKRPGQGNWGQGPSCDPPPLTPEFYPCCGGRARHHDGCKISLRVPPIQGDP